MPADESQAEYVPLEGRGSHEYDPSSPTPRPVKKSKRYIDWFIRFVILTVYFGVILFSVAFLIWRIYVHFHVPASSAPTIRDDSRPLILYAYHETENARRNAMFFIAHGLHAAADFIFILNGETNLTASLPDAPNIRAIQRPNTCFDLGAYREVLTADDGALMRRYTRFIMMNASIRGPFLPVWSRECWSDVYLDKITDTTKLVGMTYNCNPYFGTPHIQSMLLATDLTGLKSILPILTCADDWLSAVYMESNTTAAITAAGYNVFAMMTAFSSHRDYPAVCDNGDVLFDGTYFGQTIHPYEMVFQKANRNVGTGMLELLTRWTDQAGYSSWEVCGKAVADIGALGGWGRWNQTPYQ
ncbi:hypothetical protein ABW21_db0202408 [Orbilia brochopaga]|nr:hypothetical protein ABW21_db0202408 [Drechslerella brochopaga]